MSEITALQALDQVRHHGHDEADPHAVQNDSQQNKDHGKAALHIGLRILYRVDLYRATQFATLLSSNASALGSDRNGECDVGRSLTVLAGQSSVMVTWNAGGIVRSSVQRM